MKAEIITSSMQCSNELYQTIGVMGIVLLCLLFGFMLCRRISIRQKLEKRIDIQRRHIVG